MCTCRHRHEGNLARLSPCSRRVLAAVSPWCRWCCRALAVLLPCSRRALTVLVVLSLCSCGAITVLSPCSRRALTVLSPWSRRGLAVVSPWSRRGRAVVSPWSPSTVLAQETEWCYVCVGILWIQIIVLDIVSIYILHTFQILPNFAKF